MSWTPRVVGIGSPHGDDQAGWRLVEMLGRDPGLTITAHAVGDPTALLDHLDGCHDLVIVDACQTGAVAGTITRLEWPDPRILRQHGYSTHRFGVPAVLELAQQLQRLPERVILFGIEVAGRHTLAKMSADVAEAMEELQRRVVAEVQRGNVRTTAVSF